MLSDKQIPEHPWDTLNLEITHSLLIQESYKYKWDTLYLEHSTRYQEILSELPLQEH